MRHGALHSSEFCLLLYSIRSSENTDYLQSEANATEFSRKLPSVNTPAFSEISCPSWSDGLKISHAPRLMRIARFNIPVDIYFIQHLLFRVMFTVQNWKIVCVNCRALAENHYKPQFCEDPGLRVCPDPLVTVDDKIAHAAGGEVAAVSDIEHLHFRRLQLCDVPGKPTEKSIVDTIATK